MTSGASPNYSSETPSAALAPAAIGFGMLRIDVNHSDHQAAVREALHLGVDLFDVGEFDGAPEKFRANVNLVTSLAENRRVKLLVRGSLGHAGEFSAPTSGPGVEWIYLISDPEFSLPSVEWDHALFYGKLSAELDELERMSVSGKISGYGVGSSGFIYPKEHPEALSLSPLLFGPEEDFISGDRTADRAGDRPANRRHFQWIEFPFNLYESEAALDENQVYGVREFKAGTLLDAARAFGLRTIARRPLDALTDSGLRRLVNYPDHHRVDLNLGLSRVLEAALSAEMEYLGKANHAKQAAGASSEGLDPLWAHRLHDQLRYVQDPEQWKEIVRRKIAPDLEALQARDDETSETRAHYFQAMEALLLTVKLWCEKNAAERNERLRTEMIQASRELQKHRLVEDRDLAALALRVYRSVPGLNTILVGMRSPAYVRALLPNVKGARTSELPAEEIRSILIAAHTSLHEEFHD